MLRSLAFPLIMLVLCRLKDFLCHRGLLTRRDAIMSRTIAKTRLREMLLLLLLLISANCRPHRGTITADVSVNLTDACVSGCVCSPRTIVCQRKNAVASFPRLRLEAASNITRM